MLEIQTEQTLSWEDFTRFYKEVCRRAWYLKINYFTLSLVLSHGAVVIINNTDCALMLNKIPFIFFVMFSQCLHDLHLMLTRDPLFSHGLDLERAPSQLFLVNNDFRMTVKRIRHTVQKTWHRWHLKCCKISHFGKMDHVSLKYGPSRGKKTPNSPKYSLPFSFNQSWKKLQK